VRDTQNAAERDLDGAADAADGIAAGATHDDLPLDSRSRNCKASTSSRKTGVGW